MTFLHKFSRRICNISKKRKKYFNGRIPLIVGIQTDIVGLYGTSQTYTYNISEIKKGKQKVSTFIPCSEKICCEISVRKRPQIKHSRFHTRKIYFFL